MPYRHREWRSLLEADMLDEALGEGDQARAPGEGKGAAVLAGKAAAGLSPRD